MVLETKATRRPAQGKRAAPVELYAEGPRSSLPSSSTYCPRYVRACGSWTLALLDPSSGARRFVPYKCGSWRCAKCGPQVDARWASRFSAGIQSNGGPSDFVYLVLTFAQDTPAGRRKVEPFGGRVYASPREAWSALRGSPPLECDGVRIPRRIGAMGKLRERLTRARWRDLGHAGAVPPRERIRYAWSRESHASGFPHVNVVLWWPELARELREGAPRAFKSALERLRPHIVGAGFGAVAWLDAAAECEALAGYLVKRGVARTAGEMSKGSQLPLGSPANTRRFGTSRTFAPAPRRELSRYSGRIVRGPVAAVEWLHSLGSLERTFAELGAFDREQLSTLDPLTRSIALSRASRSRALARSLVECAAGVLPAVASREQASAARVPEGRDACVGGHAPVTVQWRMPLIETLPPLRPPIGGREGSSLSERASALARAVSACVSGGPAPVGRGGLPPLDDLLNKAPRASRAGEQREPAGLARPSLWGRDGPPSSGFERAARYGTHLEAVLN